MIWFYKEPSWNDLVLPMLIDELQVPFSRHALTSIDKEVGKKLKWPAFSPYSRKHGIVTVAFDRQDFSEIDRLMLARHSKKSSDNSTTLHYAILPARKKCENTLKIIHTAYETYCDKLCLPRPRHRKRKGRVETVC